MNHEEYFLGHVRPFKKEGFYSVVKTLKVFKKLWGNRIANLTIPVGSTIYVANWNLHFLSEINGIGAEKELIGGSYGKFRASKAVVHSIYSIPDSNYERSCSSYDSTFYYQVGELVKPKYPFSYAKAECESGIHFFLTVGQALGY